MAIRGKGLVSMASVFTNSSIYLNIYFLVPRPNHLHFPRPSSIFLQISGLNGFESLIFTVVMVNLDHPLYGV